MIKNEVNAEVTDNTQGSLTCPRCEGTGISGAHVICKGTGFSKPHVTCQHCRGFGSFPEK